MIELEFKMDSQGWRSQHDGRLVVADAWLSYVLGHDGASPCKRSVRLAYFGSHPSGFYVAYYR